jgi:hypothetical protein
LDACRCFKGGFLLFDASRFNILIARISSAREINRPGISMNALNSEFCGRQPTNQVNRILVRLFVLTAGLLILAVAEVRAASGVFPDPNQVALDFPDEAERYVAFNLLWDTSKLTKPNETAQRGAYYRASEGVRQKYMVAGDAAYKIFNERMGNLNVDPNFRKAVLEKYHLTNLPIQQPAPDRPNGGVVFPVTPIARSGDVTDDMIKGALVKASPYMIATLLLMALISRIMVRSASTLSAVTPARKSNDDLPALPESLRVVKLPLLEYSMDVLSAIAIDKETTMHMQSVTTTTGGQIYSVGNQVHSTPGQTSTSVSTTQVDLIWVRTAEGRETSWSFTGGDFKVRPGHFLSAIILPGKENSSEFLMAFNHNTEQFKTFRAIPFPVRHGKAWLVSAFIGSIGFGIAVAIILSIQPDSQADPIHRILQPIVDWIMGGIIAAIPALIIVGMAGGKLGRQRNVVFQRQYLPAIQPFLAERTRFLQKAAPGFGSPVSEALSVRR